MSCVTSSTVKPARRHRFTISPCIDSRVSEFELAERLVEDEQVGIVDQRARQRHALRHAARQLMRIGFGEALQADQMQRLVDARARAA